MTQPARARRLRPRVSLLAACAALAACAGAPAEPDLLLLVTVDTLRADHLGAYGDARNLTPHLDALAAESIVFERAYAPTAFTLPSIASLLTGRLPEELGVVSNRSALPNAIPTLATALRQRGWCTLAVVSNFVLRANAGLARGFDRYDDVLPGREAVRDWPERTAADTTDAALAALDASGGGRCLLWVHYQDPHGPYTPPDGRRERWLPGERARRDGGRRLDRGASSGHGAIPAYQFFDGEHEVAFYRAGYAGEVAYTDEEIGRLLRGLDARDRLARALVVFTADHGEALGEGDYWFTHGEALLEPLVRVPLLIRDPGALPRLRTDVVSLVDLWPTLLHRVTGEEVDAPGRDLLAPGADEAESVPYLAALAGSRLPRFGIVEGDEKLVTVGEGAGWRARLTRVDEEDVDLSATLPERATALERRLRDFRAGLERRAPERRQPLSEDDRRKLEALGYVDSDADAP